MDVAIDIPLDAENVAECLRRMRSGGWSRNQHFEAHQTPAATRARQLLRLLQSIERDLRQGGVLLGAEREGNTVTIRTHNSTLRLTRTLRVPAQDYSLMAGVSKALQPLGGGPETGSLGRPR